MGLGLSSLNCVASLDRIGGFKTRATLNMRGLKRRPSTKSRSWLSK
jgi:hypothetical protein